MNNVQLTLGMLIAFLEKQSPNLLVNGLGMLDSYRRYPQQLAFDPTDTQVSVKELLETCKSAKQGAFEGYKGGEFLMDNDTPLWVASYGECGTRLMNVNENGYLETKDEAL